MTDLPATPDTALDPRESGPAPQCANCGAELFGPYCHVCGQHAKHQLKHLPALLGEAMDVVLNLDGRIMHTLPALFLRPGFLAREYFAGRRVRYISPLRLAFFLSVLAFLLIQLNLSLNLIFNPTVSHKQQHETPSAQASVKPDSSSADASSDKTAATQEQASSVHIDWLPDFINTRIDADIDQAHANLRAMRSHDKDVRNRAVKSLVSHTLSVLPGTLFVLLPVFTLLLKIIYLFKRRLYIEHLIVMLFSHAFIFMTLLLSALVSLMHHALPGWAAMPVGWLQWALWIWVPIYLLLMQKRVYAQNWFLTVLKFVFVGVCYSVLLLFALTIAGVIGLAA